MATYRLVYDSRHQQADCQERDQLWNPTLGNRVRATFTFLDVRIGGKCPTFGDHPAPGDGGGR